MWILSKQTRKTINWKIKKIYWEWFGFLWLSKNNSKIQKRGREYENSIRLDYLSRLNERYEAWIGEYSKGKVLIIEVDNLDFAKNEENLGSIIEKIDAEINGLF